MIVCDEHSVIASMPIDQALVPAVAPTHQALLSADEGKHMLAQGYGKIINLAESWLNTH